MSRQKLLPVVTLLMIVSLLLTACGGQTIIQTVEVPKEVLVTQQVEVPVVQTQVVEVQAGSFTRPHPFSATRVFARRSPTAPTSLN